MQIFDITEPRNYPLVMTNIAMVEPWPIEIDGLPFLKMVIFPWRTVVILSGKGQMRTSMEPLNMDFGR